MTDPNRIAADLMAAVARNNSAAGCASMLAKFARKLADPPATITALVAVVAAGGLPTTMTPDDRREASRCAGRLVELAAGQRLSVAELLARERVVDVIAQVNNPNKQ